MAEQESAPAKSKGWLKLAVGAVGGIASGVVAMYVTAAVNWVAKPAPPVANFRFDTAGLTVQFHDMSTGGQGWWDFGDGSPLEPVSSDRPTVPHTYPQPGDYTVKMTLHSILGEAQERSVTVRLSAKAAAEATRVVSLEAVPISPGGYAPATFRLTSKVSNAQLCVWDLGDEQPMEVVTGPGEGQDRLVTFRKPGRHLIRLAVVNGPNNDQKSQTVTVQPPPAGALTAMLTVADSGNQVDSVTNQHIFAASFPPQQTGNTYHFECPAAAQSGCVFADAKLTSGKSILPIAGKTELALDAKALNLPRVQNLKLQMTPDRANLKLTGDLVKDTAMPKGKAEIPSFNLLVTLTEQRQTSADRSLLAGTVMLPAPRGATPSSGSIPLPKLPSNWVNPTRKLSLELHDGDKVLWKGSDLPNKELVTMGQRHGLLSATKAGESVRIELLDAGGGR
jgi:PKD repeat protein